MRNYRYSPKAEENLAEIGWTDIELASLNAQVIALAETPGRGYLIPFQDPFLLKNERLYRYDVGRFKLNFIFDDNHLTVISIMI